MQIARKESSLSRQVTNEKKDDLKIALAKILFGIERTWKLKPNELAEILHRAPSTVANWKRNESVSVSSDKPSPNDSQIYGFIELYDSLSAFFVCVEDQTGWLRTKSPDFGDKSPLDLLKKEVKYLYKLHEWIDHVASS